MSCVAEPKATSSAHQIIGRKPALGSFSAMPMSPTITTPCASSSQPRRRPSKVVSGGSGSRSTSGAHTHLNAYARPTQLRKPMVARSMPASRKRKLSVPRTSSSGNPAEKPRASMRNVAGSR